MPTVQPQFDPATTEQISRILGDLFTGSELSRILSEAGFAEFDPGEGLTKWRRLDIALNNRQVRTKNGTPVLKFLTVAMRPQRTLSRVADAAIARDALNQALSLAALKLREDGQIVRVSRARSDTEAQRRSNLLRTHLQSRGVHPAVLEFCRPELLRDDYYEAVFEAIKGLGDRLRRIASVDLDGFRLAEGTLGGQDPPIKLSDLATETKRNEQRGVMRLAEGLFSAFRNPAAHEPRNLWMMTEQDALDVLGTLSLVHRRIDGADPSK